MDGHRGGGRGILLLLPVPLQALLLFLWGETFFFFLELWDWRRPYLWIALAATMASNIFLPFLNLFLLVCVSWTEFGDSGTEDVEDMNAQLKL